MFIIGIIDDCVEMSKRAIAIQEKGIEEFTEVKPDPVLNIKGKSREQVKAEALEIYKSKIEFLKHQYDVACTTLSIEDITAALERSKRIISDIEQQYEILTGKLSWAEREGEKARCNGIRISANRFNTFKEETQTALTNLTQTLRLRQNFSRQLEVICKEKAHKKATI